MASRSKQILKQYLTSLDIEYSEKNLKKVLEDLYHNQYLSPLDIANTIFAEVGRKLSADSVRYWMKKTGVPLRSYRMSLLERRVLECGYTDIETYFFTNAEKSLTDMSDELDISMTKIQQSYKKFLEDD